MKKVSGKRPKSRVLVHRPSEDGGAEVKPEFVQEKEESKIGKASFLPTLAALSAVGAVVLHLMGLVTHQNYLDGVGIDSGLFPRGTDWYLTNGFYSFIGRSFSVLEKFKSGWPFLFTMAFITAVYFYGLQLVLRKIREHGFDTKLKESHPLLKDAWISLLASSLLWFAIPVGFSIVVMVIAVPAALGETAGSDAAASKIELARGPCNVENPCVQLLRDGKVVLEGPVIESSVSHIAVFDPAFGRVRVVERSGLELRGEVAMWKVSTGASAGLRDENHDERSKELTE